LGPSSSFSFTETPILVTLPKFLPHAEIISPLPSSYTTPIRFYGRIHPPPSPCSALRSWFRDGTPFLFHWTIRGTDPSPPPGNCLPSPPLVPLFSFSAARCSSFLQARLDPLPFLPASQRCLFAFDPRFPLALHTIPPPPPLLAMSLVFLLSRPFFSLPRRIVLLIPLLELQFRVPRLRKQSAVSPSSSAFTRLGFRCPPPSFPRKKIFLHPSFSFFSGSAFPSEEDDPATRSPFFTQKGPSVRIPFPSLPFGVCGCLSPPFFLDFLWVSSAAGLFTHHGKLKLPDSCFLAVFHLKTSPLFFFSFLSATFCERPRTEWNSFCPGGYVLTIQCLSPLPLFFLFSVEAQGNIFSPPPPFLLWNLVTLHRPKNNFHFFFRAQVVAWNSSFSFFPFSVSRDCPPLFPFFCTGLIHPHGTGLRNISFFFPPHSGVGAFFFPFYDIADLMVSLPPFLPREHIEIPREKGFLCCGSDRTPSFFFLSLREILSSLGLFSSPKRGRRA